MSSVTTIALAGLLIGLFLLITAALVWQEAKRRGAVDEPVLVIEDAVDYVYGRLGDEERRRLAKPGVRRILEWDVYYLQGLAQPRRSTPVETVAGDHEPAVVYVAEQIEARHGMSYSLADIRSVLALMAGYLTEIGVVGEVVTEQTEGGDGR